MLARLLTQHSYEIDSAQNQQRTVALDIVVQKRTSFRLLYAVTHSWQHHRTWLRL